ncbi:hypothetical protein [Streptomyces sp. NPDC005181]|uniref:hypothetical protein n=1 Tax=Streptomyces sp. NPDC005181 TaxID=3156869 RepID=UPI0033A6EFF2
MASPGDAPLRNRVVEPAATGHLRCGSGGAADLPSSSTRPAHAESVDIAPAEAYGAADLLGYQD